MLCNEEETTNHAISCWDIGSILAPWICVSMTKQGTYSQK